MIFVILTMIFKAPVVPYFLTLKNLGFYNNPIVLVIPHIFSAYNMTIMRTSFKAFPSEIEEAAVIDGCGTAQVLFRIVFPSFKAMLTTMALFYGVTAWNTQGIGMAMSLKPDIILTDIKMPNLDGIGMIRQLISAGSASRFVILTGYSDFNYAKSAISLGVENYITKPIDKEELFLTIRKIHSDIQKKSEDTKELQRMKDVFQNYGFSMREYALKRYIETSHAKRGELTLFFKEIGMEMKAKKI